MKLHELLTNVADLSQLPSHPAINTQVKGITTNSHACQPGDLFIGMPGTRVDGGEFWESAIASGAIAAIVSSQAVQKQSPLDRTVQGKIPCVISVPNMTQACAQIAAAFYGYPAQQLKLVGVTGTNGKTTTTHLIEFFLTQAHLPTALFGTLYTRWADFEQTSAHTTPFAPELQQQLATAVASGCQLGVMEVSSHALAQGRVLGCPFDVAVFTNLTQDHLDFHHNLENYFAAKQLLFTPEYLQGMAVINLDDPYGRRIIAQLPPEQVCSYSISNQAADLWMSELNYSSTGVSGLLHTPQGDTVFRSPLVGQFNILNFLAAVGTVLHLKLDLPSVIESLPHFPGVPGRMERVQIGQEQDVSVIVDYAHTPDSLENLLTAARPFIQGKMICVFGCGGDRDRTKRPKMGEIAAQKADVVIVTSDNPRTETPERILQDILAGIPTSIQPTVISDRSTAIRTAIVQAQPGDGILIAGKGHEDYQILGTEKIHFDDREQAREALLERIKKLSVG